MDLHLKDKVALVTGAGSQIGYGKAIALTLAGEGCDVIAADINLDGAKQTAAAIEALGRKALAVKVDVTNQAEVDAMVKKGIEKFGRIDILVNNAGASSQLRPFIEMTEEDWDFDIKTNLYGQMRVARAVLPQMIERRYGRIINTSGGQGIPNISIYGAAKAGVVMFTQALAREVASQGVIVNAVGPGLGKTGLVYRAPQEFLEGEKQRSLLKRLCEPSDVAPVVAFLASDRCSYMVGQLVQLSTS
ncbi:MAG TPA: SDR family NAD(P)-dependent oxidoreductase [Dehalococcoidales bacterium]|nr:SDR family NAD(P)-dependent oxidoreductase [Dehalococcoidales bacterium]